MGYDTSIRNTYPKVIKTLGAIKRPDLQDHEFMANEYIPYLKAVFQEVDSLLSLGPHYIYGTTTINTDYFTAMAWNGLQETSAWLLLPLADRNKYELIMSREAYNGTGCN
jgi:hypothetical protein